MEIIVIEQFDMVLIVIVEGLDVSCFGDRDGCIEIVAVGGMFIYCYFIDGGVFFFGNFIFIGLDFGIYDVQVIDVNGCCFFVEDVVVGELDEIIVDFGGI